MNYYCMMNGVLCSLVLLLFCFFFVYRCVLTDSSPSPSPSPQIQIQTCFLPMDDGGGGGGGGITLVMLSCSSHYSFSVAFFLKSRLEERTVSKHLVVVFVCAPNFHVGDIRRPIHVISFFRCCLF